MVLEDISKILILKTCVVFALRREVLLVSLKGSWLDKMVSRQVNKSLRILFILKLGMLTNQPMSRECGEVSRCSNYRSLLLVT